MTQYSNPKIKEGINVSHDHPLKEFASLLIGVGLMVITGVVILALAAEWLVRFVPFSVEEKLAGSFDPMSALSSAAPVSDNHDAIEAYLQNLADQLARQQSLPDDMHITVHYVETDMVNAYATLGGHITIFKGLLDRIDSENTLAMVVAHEIGHVKHRDPIVSLGRGVTIGLALMSIAGFGDGGFSQQLVGQIGNVTALTFSRNQETDADTSALETLHQHYGHVEGAEKLFELFSSVGSMDYQPALFRTHPMDDDRIAAAQAFKRNHPATQNPQITPLPAW